MLFCEGTKICKYITESTGVVDIDSSTRVCFRSSQTQSWSGLKGTDSFSFNLRCWLGDFKDDQEDPTLGFGFAQSFERNRRNSQGGLKNPEGTQRIFKELQDTPTNPKNFPCQQMFEAPLGPGVRDNQDGMSILSFVMGLYVLHSSKEPSDLNLPVVWGTYHKHGGSRDMIM